jgi:hypothetical protein
VPGEKPEPTRNRRGGVSDMGRKREFDEDRMLAVIRDQFWSRGYEATST